MGKDSRLQIIRRITQVLSLVFSTGLFVIAFNGFQTIYILLINHNFSLAKLEMFGAPFGVTVILSLLFGRIFCGWFCAFGAVNDFLYYLSQNLFKIRWRISPTWDSRLKHLKYIILGLIIVAVWTLKWVSPDYYSHWSAVTQLKGVLRGQFIPGVSWLIFAVIMGGALLIDRFFCRYLCPLGAILAPFSKVSLTKITNPTTNCKSCQSCSADCPMGIDLRKQETVKSGECIRCLECLTACPEKSPRVSSYVGNFNPVAYIFVVIVIFSLINILETVHFTPFQAFDGKSATPATNGAVPRQAEKVTATPVPVATASPVLDDQFSASEDISAAEQPASLNADSASQCRDGVYRGTATGFRPGLQLTVTVQNNQISDIQITESHDDPPFLNRASEEVIPAIIANQGTTVDAVSGATLSSRGIMEAVKDALRQAEK